MIQSDKNPTPSVVRNPTPPKNLRLSSSPERLRDPGEDVT